MSKKITIIDPPEGWRYGFPKKLPKGKDPKELLREAGYPEKNIDFALTHCSMWEVEEE